MKEAELRQHTTCSLCRQKVLASGLPLFWRVSIERFGIDMQAATRQTGLALAMGSAQLAAIMGPDEDIARPVMDKAVLTVCEQCAIGCQVNLAHLALEAQR